MVDEPFELTASKVASLIGVAQSAETLVEVLAGMLLGERSRERLLTLLEAYKACCRLRLLRLQPVGSLMQSLPPQSRTGGRAAGRHSLGGRSELSVRAGAPTAVQAGGVVRWPRANPRAGACNETGAHANKAAAAASEPLSPAALRLGEVLPDPDPHLNPDPDPDPSPNPNPSPNPKANRNRNRNRSPDPNPDSHQVLHILAPVLHLMLVQLLPSPSGRRSSGARPWSASPEPHAALRVRLRSRARVCCD